MIYRPTMWRLGRLGLILIAGLFAAGCVIRDPQAITDINKAREAIDGAKKAGAADRFPDDYAALEKRFLEARGVFYACQDDKASSLALALANDANALATKRVEAPAPPPPSPPAPPANKPPVAQIKAPAEVEVNTLVTFDAAGSSDPDGDKLTYKWDFGDGQTSSFTFPNATHRYAKAGSYTVQLTVDDGRGGSNSTTAKLTVIRKVVLSEEKGRVLFDFDKATLRPEAQKTLAEVVKDLKENAALRADLVGHADAIGSDQYNMGLSKRRAEAVQKFLVKEGIAANRISVAWKGESEPVAPNTTKEGRAKNRRVEITVRP